MTKKFLRSRWAVWTVALGFVASCSGSGGSGASSSGSNSPLFSLVGVSVANNSTLTLNSEIQLSFSNAVDFTSLSDSNIQILTDQGVSATGFLSPLMLDTDGDGELDAADTTVVVWTPGCPIRSDFSDSGLLPNTTYTLRLRGSDSQPSQLLRGANGGVLDQSVSRRFSTPNSNDVSVLFEDPVPGGPMPLIRGRGEMLQSRITYVEIGGNLDPESRLYFERDDMGTQSLVVPGMLANPLGLAPLNLFSDESTSVAFLLELNQPVNPSESNLSNDFIRLEYLVPAVGAQWVALDTRVELLSNCTAMGTSVRLQAAGLLPADVQVRAVLLTGFQGLGGLPDGLLADQFNFAVLQTQQLDFAALANPSLGADEVLEEFDLGGSGPGSLEAFGSDSLLPPASWGQGELAASHNFDGKGGPGGNFDWIIVDNPEPFDTSSQTIVGGPNGMRSFQQFTVGGIVDVHDFIILPGAQLRVTGPNPFVLSATGEIRIEGRLDISGFSARDVATLNTGHLPEKGGAGVCGGGMGGGASSIVDNATPRGCMGEGAFGEPLAGGEGGESALTDVLGQFTTRRPGGGGGGAFALNQTDVDSTTVQGNQPSVGMQAEVGGEGDVDSFGVRSLIQPCPGGLPGAGAFSDADPRNDFFGLRVDAQIAILADGSAPVLVSQAGIIRGELSGIHAGYGGGGGGDALSGSLFPNPNWSRASDEKGGGGGGGAGAIHLRALGRIRFVGFSSRLRCQGGGGATGEIKIGGIGGSGSGGHVILESASKITFELPPVSDRPVGQRRRIFVDARGTIGRLGPLGGVSRGGSGGAGVIQLHVPDGLAPPHEDESLSDLILPEGTIEDLDAGDSNALLEVTRPGALQLLPNFGALSKSQSRWIDLRTVGIGADGSRGLLNFLFEGIDPLDGSVLSQNGRVTPMPALLAGTVDGLGVSFEGRDGLSFGSSEIQALIDSNKPISEDIYLRTPALLRNFILRMTPGIGVSLDFVVQDAFYDASVPSLVVRVAQLGRTELSDLAGAAQDPSYELIPRFFMVVGAGSENQLDDSKAIYLSFEGARAAPDGSPDTSVLVVPETSDLADFQALMPGELDFIRFNVEFDLDLLGVGVDPDDSDLSLDFLRLPFVY